MPSTAATDLRFAFGANWRHFLDTVDADRVGHATDSLAALLGSERVRGRSFLDIGSGSGLSSLAALSLGAHATNQLLEPLPIALSAHNSVNTNQSPTRFDILPKSQTLGISIKNIIVGAGKN